MRLVYDVEDKPQLKQLIVFAFQQVLAIMAATIAVPMIVGNGMSTAAALFGAGVGTIVYTLFTHRKSPVFLGSSFAFIGSMSAAFAGAVSANAGFAGLIIGALFAGLVYVVFALVINRVGVDWVDKLMPPVSRFGGGRAAKKQTVIDKLKAFFEKYFGLGINSFAEDDAAGVDAAETVEATTGSAAEYEFDEADKGYSLAAESVQK
jgi:hypothetical protein